MACTDPAAVQNFLHRKSWVIQAPLPALRAFRFLPSEQLLPFVFSHAPLFEVLHLSSHSVAVSTPPTSSCTTMAVWPRFDLASPMQGVVVRFWQGGSTHPAACAIPLKHLRLLGANFICRFLIPYGVQYVVLVQALEVGVARIPALCSG